MSERDVEGGGRTNRVWIALEERNVRYQYLKTDDVAPVSKEHPSILHEDAYGKSWARLNIQHITNARKSFRATSGSSKLNSPLSNPPPSTSSTHLRFFAARMKKCGPYFAGKQWTAVDATLTPFVERFYQLER
ncbi:hypothetical protein IAR50_006629 [Cryptococcus sp. DSM 104548]